MVRLQGYIRFSATDWQEVLRVLPLHVQLTRAEAGCLKFEVTPDADEQYRLNVSEVFINQAAFEAHQRRTQSSHWAKVTINAQRCYQILSEESQASARGFDLIGAPFNLLGCYTTSANPIEQLRQSDETTWLGLEQWRTIRNTRWGAYISDKGDVLAEPSVLAAVEQNRKEMALHLYSEQLKASVRQSYLDGRIPITIGADHSIAVATVQATLEHFQKNQRKRVAVIWVDAHADCNNQAESNLHGKPVALLMDRYLHPDWRVTDGMKLSPHDIYYIAVRDLMPAEQQLMNELGMVSFSMDMIEEQGINQVTQSLLAHLAQNYDHIYLSFDYDALDGAIYRACATPNLAGLSAREALYLVRTIAAHEKFVGADFVEYLPELDSKGVSKELMIKLLDAVWGYAI